MLFATVLEFLAKNKPLKGEFLAIDLGTKKTGIAVSIGGMKMAVPSCVIYEASLEGLLARIKLLMKEKECSYIALGFPFAWEEGLSAKRIMKFAKMLASTGFSVLLYDENNTSIKVKSTAYEARGKMTKKEMQSYDAKVASFILSNLLEEIHSINT